MWLASVAASRGSNSTALIPRLACQCEDQIPQNMLLSNDVPRWSIKFRRLFEIEVAIDPWIISGDVGHRKPSPVIYQRLLRSAAGSCSQSRIRRRSI